MSDLNAILAGTVDDVAAAIGTLSNNQLVELRTLEEADKSRKGVLTAIAAALAALAGAADGATEETAASPVVVDAGEFADGPVPNAADVVADTPPVAVDPSHPALDSDFRAGTTEAMNRIDLNDPYQGGRQIVEAALATRGEG